MFDVGFFFFFPKSDLFGNLCHSANVHKGFFGGFFVVVVLSCFVVGFFFFFVVS